MMTTISFQFPVDQLAEQLEESEVYAGAESSPLIIRKRVTGYQAVRDGRVVYRSKYLDNVIRDAMHRYGTDRIVFRTVLR